MQGIYKYIPEKNLVSRVYSIAAVLYLQFVLHVMLFRPWNMFCTFTLALSVVCVQCPIWLFFCISLISCFPGMLLRYCLSDFKIVPIAPIFTDIIFAFTFHMRWISITSSLYFKIFSASFLITLLSPGIATSVSMHVPFLLSRIMMSGLLLGIVLSVCTCWSHNMVALILYYYYYYYYYYLRKYVATEVGNTWIITLAPGSAVVVVTVLRAGRLVMIPNWGTGLHVPANVGYDYGPPSLLFIGYRG